MGSRQSAAHSSMISLFPEAGDWVELHADLARKALGVAWRNDADIHPSIQGIAFVATQYLTENQRLRSELDRVGREKFALETECRQLREEKTSTEIGKPTIHDIAQTAFSEARNSWDSAWPVPNKFIPEFLSDGDGEMYLRVWMVFEQVQTDVSSVRTLMEIERSITNRFITHKLNMYVVFCYRTKTEEESLQSL